eukprot:CAMPEP_0174963442 /NCGR_PEP_ID=MMETSP0004_2-20121128/5332_1 /TAXON_ID=420556 /ORGANISM="Ochromonas sp., Strain CCMP1393" /LENGTH=468 /DNA_ID=CAMNT_0016212067 /DNA_START=119 /DNA_END=1525 /DNA_ORIENTATION=-
MIRAQQRAVVQEANINLVNIRSAEVDYFRTFFNQFGTQCALMIGFIAGAVSQVPALANPSHSPYFWIVMYWIGSAGTVAAATHVLVSTVFISVFGQGLAIRGPIGSMISAIDGMIIEQQQVLFFFVVTVVFFAFQAIGMYWVMMDSTSAIVSTVITGIAMWFWYTHSLRIFNRFRWDTKMADWKLSPTADDEIKELHPTLEKPPGTDFHDDSSLYRKRKGLRFFPGFKFGFGTSRRKKSQHHDGYESEMTSPVENPYYHMDSEAAIPNHAEQLSHPSSSSLPPPQAGTGGVREEKEDDDDDDDEYANAGYMSTIQQSASKSFFRKEGVWERRFFVVTDDNLMYYYKDQYSYEEDPYKPINHRPIDLEGYTLIAGTIEPPYAISLIPIDPDDIRKAWKFRCDTISEFQHWVEVLNNALQRCRPSSGDGDGDGNDGSGDLLRIPGGSSVADSADLHQVYLSSSSQRMHKS